MNNFLAYGAAVVCTLLISACGNKLPGKDDMVVMGEVDWDQLVTPDELNKLTDEEFVERYEGKEITIMLNGAKWGGGYDSAKGQCLTYFSWPQYNNLLEEGEVRYKAHVYLNHFPDYVIQDSLIEEFEDANVSYRGENDMPFAFCKKKCDWDSSDPWACPQMTSYSVLSGRIFLMFDKETPIIRGMKMRLKGLAVMKN